MGQQIVIEKGELIVDNISFFIPAYNCEEWVEEAADSIMETNFENGDELIICNDCSTDNTANILKKIKEKYQDKDLTIITHKVNKGGPSARNTAIDKARNEIVFCLDSDNVLEKNSITPLKKFMLEQKADVASFGGLRYFKDGTEKEKTTHTWIYKEPDFTLQDALSTVKFPGASGNYMYTKEIWHRVRGFIPHTFGIDNWSYGIRVLFEGAKMVVLKDTYYFHRFGMEGDWLAFTKKYTPSLMALSILAPYLDKIKDSDVNYMINGGRHTWFENLDEHPIRLKTEKEMELDKKKKKIAQSIFKFISIFVPIKNWRRKIRELA